MNTYSQSAITLRDYQAECVDKIDKLPPGAYLAQMATGLGKTATFTNIPRKGRVLVLAHREELVRQPVKYYNCPVGIERAEETSNGEEVVIASVQSLTRRLGRFSPDAFDMIITDECFPSGTLVDGIPIEDIKIGDFVTSINHETGIPEPRRVLHKFANPAPKEMVKINGVLVCTTGHPIYCMNERKYKDAGSFEVGDCLLFCVQHSDSMGNPYKAPKAILSESGQNLLQSELFKGILSPGIIENDGRNEQKICLRAHEEKESYAQPRDPRKNGEHIEEDRTQTAVSRRKWSTDGATDVAGKRTFNSGTSDGICCSNEENYTSCPGFLQGGYCHTCIQSCNRGGWWEPLRPKETGRGQKEGYSFSCIRVESVEVLEQGHNVGRDSLCPDGYVYNLEVEGNNNYFADGFLVHNCHHASAQSYRRIYEHFSPRLHIGFTATPGRGDKVRLNDIYSSIIFSRDLRWGIEHNYLSDIFCRRVNIGYDLSAVHTRAGDYAPGELEEAMDGTADAIAQAYRELATGATLVFAVSVAQAEEIASRIPGAVVVTGETKNRAAIVEAFTAGEIPCIVNCMVFTEGTDIPRVETIIMARPTQSDSLYCQMVGRGLRLFPGKERLNLIDCVGVTGRASLCTAPSLLGIDLSEIPEAKKSDIQGDLFDLPTKVERLADCPESWIKNIKIVDLWAKEQKYNLHDINFFRMPTGDLVVSLPNKFRITIPCPNELGQTTVFGRTMLMQEAIDNVFLYLQSHHENDKYIWDLNAVKQWGKRPASDKQIDLISKRCKGFDPSGLTKGEASMVLNRVLGGGKR